MIKSNEEVAMIRRSAAMVDKAMLAGYQATRAGVTADHIDAVVNQSLLDSGGEYMGCRRSSWPGPVVASHIRPGDNKLDAVDVCTSRSASERCYAALRCEQSLSDNRRTNGVGPQKPASVRSRPR